MTRTCAGCSSSFEGRSDAKWCSEKCRKKAARGRVITLGGNPASPDAFTGRVHAQAVKDLTEAGRLDTVLGQACLVLAARIDQNADTGTALAGAIKQLEASMASALKGAAVAASPLDELRARRDAKRGA